MSAARNSAGLALVEAVMRLALVLVLACLVHSPLHADSTVVFSNVHVIPMDREHVLDARDVVVRNGVIRAIESHHDRTWPPDTRVVDGTGRFLIPGLNDLHVHTQFGDERQLELYVANGVTTVLNLSGTPQILAWKRRIDRGELLGPNLYSSGPILDGDPPTNPTHAIVHDRTEAERAVREQVAVGYDFIKPYSALSEDAYFGIVEAAHESNIRLVGHVSWNVGVERTIDADQSAIAHVEELYRHFVDRHRKPPPDTRPDSTRIRALAKRLHAHDVWVITTLSSNTNILDQATRLEDVLQRPEMVYVPASYLAECRTGDPYAARGADWVQQNRIMVPFLFRIVAGLREGGVRMIAGTDATNPIQVPGVSLHEELAELVQAGLTPYQALWTSTRNPALFLGRGKVAGAITPGRFAELVLLDANPLDDIRNTTRIAGVMLHGNWFDHERIEAMKREIVEHMARQ